MIELSNLVTGLFHFSPPPTSFIVLFPSIGKRVLINAKFDACFATAIRFDEIICEDDLFVIFKISCIYIFFFLVSCGYYYMKF